MDRFTDGDSLDPTFEAPAPAVGSMSKQALSTSLALAVFIAAGFWVQSTYWPARHYMDDLHHLTNAAMLRDGQLTWGDYLFEPHNEHVIPLWKFWYYVQWRTFGLSTVPWHAAMTGMHLLSAVCLYLTASKYFAHRFAAAAAGLLWAGAAIGQTENPLLWIAASHLGMAINWIVIAMWCVSRMDGPNRNRWAAGMAFCTVAAASTTGATLVLAPVLPLQCLLLEGGWKNLRRNARLWTAAWLVPCLLLGLLQIFKAMPQIERVNLAGTEPDLLRVTYLTGTAHANALANLLFWMPEAHPTMGVAAKTAMACCVGGMALIAGRRFRWRLPATIAAVSIGYSLLVYFSRQAVPDHTLLQWGRYAYLPTILGCVLLAAILDAAMSMAANGRRIAIIAAMSGVAVLYVNHQQAIAAFAFDGFQAESKQYRDLADRYRVFLKAASRTASASGEPIVLPDHTVDFPVVSQSLSQFSGYAFPRRLSGIEFEDPERLSAARLQFGLELAESLAVDGTQDYRDAIRGWIDERAARTASAPTPRRK